MVSPLKIPAGISFYSSLAGWVRTIKGALINLSISAALVILVLSPSLAAEVSSTNEYELKAAFLYNFIKFTEWPPDEMGKSGHPFVIGVLGKDPFGPALDKIIEGETIHNKKIIARRFARLDDSAASSHVLFISSSEENNLAAILKHLDGQAVLTISEIVNFAQRGGVIDLKKENNRIVFEINLVAAKRAGLSMNAQLLKLAKVVRGRT